MGQGSLEGQIVAAIRARPLLFIGATNALTALTALYLNAGGWRNVRKMLEKAAFRLVVGSARLVAGELVKKEEAKILEGVRDSVVGKIHGERYRSLPKDGMSTESVVKLMREGYARDGESWSKGQVSGQVYHGGKDVTGLLVDAFSIYAVSNPIHPETFPSVRKMEAEVVQMVCDLFHGGSEACGTTTSGGTESNFMTVKTHRDWALKVRGITSPELIKPASAHASFDKACHILGVKCIEVPFDPVTFKVDLKEVKKRLSRNTIMLVGSAPTYPHGVMDDIVALSDMAVQRGCGLHVDCCLGSFVVPFLSEIGYKTPLFDFRLKGVSSISCDTHKYGFAPKGSSIIMYKGKDLRHHQYFVASDWPGGIYATPALAGSRPGALIAGTWAVMMHMGMSGYKQCAKDIMRTATHIINGVEKMEGVRLMGRPDAFVVCVGADDPDKLNIFNVGDAMSERGWRLSLMQFPSCLHFCVTYLAARQDAGPRFLADLEASIHCVRTAPKGKFKDSKGAIYGMAASIPDRTMVDGMALTYIDAQYYA
uniref:sphinganine-1-phosphate aldolase n=1 Tax=Hemiselmis andersenii TaxID=464988 RepID=A0A6T8I5R7_HEMAN|mmetsp:Transcript_3868/g.8751  ORF Transcript_3868/g.8751 Transcript_3868/m.8751 type:complete len:538 (+) Transcript_3868:134-1747(+)